MIGSDSDGGLSIRGPTAIFRFMFPSRERWIYRHSREQSAELTGNNPVPGRHCAVFAAPVADDPKVFSSEMSVAIVELLTEECGIRDAVDTEGAEAAPQLAPGAERPATTPEHQGKGPEGPPRGFAIPPAVGDAALASVFDATARNSHGFAPVSRLREIRGK